MSHPYWPQPGYVFRRMKAAPVPDAYGGFGYVSARAPLMSRGSLSPKYDWATPRYIRDERDGLGDFGEDGCVGGLTGAIAKYLAGKLKDAVGYPTSCPSIIDDPSGFALCNGKKVALDNVEGLISGVIGAALSGISGDLSDAGVRSQVHDAIASRLPGISIPSLGIDVSGILTSVIDAAIEAAISTCGSFLNAGSGGGCAASDENFQKWCAAGDMSCIDATPEAFQQWCTGHGYPWGGLQTLQPMLQPLQQTAMVAPGTFTKPKPSYMINKDMLDLIQRNVPPTGVPPTTVPAAAGGGSAGVLLIGAALAAFLLLK